MHRKQEEGVVEEFKKIAARLKEIVKPLEEVVKKYRISTQARSAVLFRIAK